MDLFPKSLFSLNVCIFCTRKCDGTTSRNRHFICDEGEKAKVRGLIFSKDGSKSALHKFFWELLLGSSINKSTNPEDDDDSIGKKQKTITAHLEKLDKKGDANFLPVCTSCLETSVMITRLHSDLERIQMLLIDEFSKIQKTVTSARDHFVKDEENAQKSHCVNVLQEFQEKVFMRGQNSTKIPLVFLERFHNGKLPELNKVNMCVKQEPFDEIHLNPTFPTRCESDVDDEWSPADALIGSDENSDEDYNDATSDSDQEYIPSRRPVGRPAKNPTEKRSVGRPPKDPTEKRSVGRPPKDHSEKRPVGRPPKNPTEKQAGGRSPNYPIVKRPVGRPRGSVKPYRLVIRKNFWKPPNAPEIPDERKKHFHTFYRCDLCGKKYCKRTAFLKHKRVHEELEALDNEPGASSLDPESAASEEIRICSVCQQEIPNSDYHEHLLSHEDENNKTFVCTHKDCSRKFHIEENLKIHLDVDHNEISSAASLLQIKKCDVCFMCYNTSSDLLDHFKKVHKDKKSRTLYYCPVCTHSFSVAENLISHMYSHENKDEQICFICKEPSPNRTELLAHLEQWHALKSNVDCATCGEKFDDVYWHQSHLKTAHKRKDTFICSFCGRICYFAADFMRHLSIHKRVERRGIFCDICNSAFITADKLLHHQIKFHGAPKLPCVICGGQYSNQKALILHMRLHTNKEGFKCEICGKLFSLKGALQNHMYAHKNERPYTCEICGSASKNKADLTRHLSTHDKRFECNICGRKFSRKFYLETHSKMHTNETLVCTYCGYEFHNRKSLKRHVKTYHETDNPMPLYKAQKKRRPCIKWKDSEGNVQHAKSILQLEPAGTSSSMELETNDSLQPATEATSHGTEAGSSSSNVDTTYTTPEAKFHRNWEMPFDFKMFSTYPK